jgi:uncharacterized protein DUF5335
MAKPAASGLAIPRHEWGEFLQSFSRKHYRWLVTIETHDLKTGERVASHLTPLQSVELDLEDEKNPRINVTVKLDNKEIKHILFRPSQLVLYRSEDGSDEALHIDAVNTATTIRFRVSILPELVDHAV